MYATQLRKVARQVGDLVRGLWDPADPVGSARAAADALQRYAGTIEGWARASATRFVADLARRDRKGWIDLSRELGVGLRAELDTAPTGVATRAALQRQVGLITSLPTEAAQRVRDLANENIVSGARADVLARDILRSGEVTRARANTIARTETSRTATELLRARSEHAGSTGYIWRTSRDGDVRKSHKAMEGRFIAWDEPPTLDNLQGHAGSLPNCRCYPEPVFPGDDVT